MFQIEKYEDKDAGFFKGFTQQYRLVRNLRVPAMRINHVAHGKRPVNAEIALRLGRYFDQSSRHWMNLQNRYDMDIAEDFLSEQVAREVHPLTAAL